MSARRWLPEVPRGWPDLTRETTEPYFRRLDDALAGFPEPVFPDRGRIFRALELTPRDRVRVVILGQDPYHGAGQADGLAFSVPRGVPVPPSLRNVFLELRRDVGAEPPGHGDLSAWARRGVLLLNTVLTVPAGRAGGHAGWGWERFTDAVIRSLAAAAAPSVVLLWGRHARAKAPLLGGSGHIVIETAHPSPLSARRGFLGSSCFSRANRALADRGRDPLDWSLPPGTGKDARADLALAPPTSPT